MLILSKLYLYFKQPGGNMQGGNIAGSSSVVSAYTYKKKVCVWVNEL